MLQYILSGITHFSGSPGSSLNNTNISMSGTQHDTRQLLSTDSIPPFPPPMLSLSELVCQMRKSGHSKGCFNEASNSMCIVEPPSFTSTHEDFDESSVQDRNYPCFRRRAFTPTSFFPKVPPCLLPLPIQLEQPPNPPATYANLPAMKVNLQSLIPALFPH